VRAHGYTPMRLVSADSEAEYARAIEAERKRAMATTVRSNQGLVYMAVRRYQVALRKAQGLEEADLVQAGLMGLAKAWERFDPAKGTWSTYAMWWVHHGIRRTLSNQSREIRIPCHALESGRCTGIATVSLSTPLDPDRCLGDCMAAPERDDDELDEAEQRQRLEPHLAALEPRLALVVRLRLAGKTLKEIGGELGVSRERIRQLEGLAIGQLRRALAKRKAA
jgi:RNA polymerase primary sigma factor